MSRQGTLSTAVSVVKSIARLSPLLRVMAAALVVAGALGIALAALGWMGPVLAKGHATPGDGRSMTFSYSTQVGKTPAYDTTTVTAPDPIFRKLARSVDVTLDYQGRPGSIEVLANLSTSIGWHTTMQLEPPVSFSGHSYHTAVHLDLEALDARARAAASAIGVEAGPVTVTVTSNVTSAGYATFAPALHMNLAPLQLSLVGGPTSLVVDDAGATASGQATPRTISVLGHSLMNAAAARAWSICLLLGAFFGTIGLVLVSRRATPVRDRAEIHRRFPQLLVAVEPMVSPPGKPVVNVDDFQALVRLAERYGQLVLHWSRNEVETFVVRDEGITYRYRTAAESSDAETQLVNVDRGSPTRTAAAPKNTSATKATTAKTTTARTASAKAAPVKATTPAGKAPSDEKAPTDDKGAPDKDLPDRSTV